MTDRAQRPFWFHQIVEYLIGIGIIGLGLQDLRPTVPLIGGVIILVNAASARGPLGAFRFIGRQVHRWLDLVAWVALLALAIQPWIPVEMISRAALIGVVIPLGSVWWYTDWAEKPARQARRAASAGGRSEEFGRAAGRKAGAAWRAAKQFTERD
ncbi:MAG: hypothetical protein CSA55_02485 [Ilumatobacter coccineus]|uniref:Uncharacterized protein n=1 Tax=Ilumatobacter coccineus TaxID=467094 RepID=A0A2G6KBE9_9ACTN|nr:MAG: hypothetical protein CSA55_02485 [Ilumatobacter coccineus]